MSVPHLKRGRRKEGAGRVLPVHTWLALCLERRRLWEVGRGERTELGCLHPAVKDGLQLKERCGSTSVCVGGEESEGERVWLVCVHQEEREVLPPELEEPESDELG